MYQGYILFQGPEIEYYFNEGEKSALCNIHSHCSKSVSGTSDSWSWLPRWPLVFGPDTFNAGKTRAWGWGMTDSKIALRMSC